MNKGLYLLPLFLLPFSAFAQSFYCPKHQGYINPGMNEADVINACGQPMAKREADATVKQKVPVKQLIYTVINAGSVYPTLNPIFEQWSVPSGTTQGVTLEIGIINNKVSSVQLNGSNTKAMSICGGVSIQVGDDEGKVYNACGNPTLVNNTFIYQNVPSSEKPQVWIYQIDQYQPPISLTFVKGKLQSID